MLFFGCILSIWSKRARSFVESVFFATRICSGGVIDRWNGACDWQGKSENCPKHRARKFGFLKKIMENWSWWTVWPSNSMKLLRWREFHCLVAPRYSFTWLVERYACRVIPRRGQFCDRLVDMVMVFFGCILSICSKCAKSFAEPVFFGTWMRLGGVIDR